MLLPEAVEAVMLEVLGEVVEEAVKLETAQQVLALGQGTQLQ
jgi:hypothetical protein